MKRMEKQITSLKKTAHGLTEADLIEILNYPGETITGDYRLVREQCQSTESIQTADYQLTLGIYQGAKFTSWLKGFGSAALFVERIGEQGFHRRFSPLSALSCNVIEHLKRDGDALSIHHFCRLHTTQDTSTSMQLHTDGPAGLMRSLIHQVLQLFPQRLNLGFVSSKQYRDQLESGHVGRLAECFAGILQQLPAYAVLFCIIDGIDSFEKHAWSDDLTSVMDDLMELARDTGEGLQFKLLVNSSNRSKYAKRAFPAECRMSVSADGSTTRHNPSEREVSIATRRPMAPVSQTYRNLSNELHDAAQYSADDTDSDDPDANKWKLSVR
jgi:hypothetical protein